MIATKLHFTRFEFKYVLPPRMRSDVEAELGHFVELDPFVAQQPDQRYFVRSLYFDDDRLTAFHDKIDGIMHRSKFRLRTYSNSRDDPRPWFLEIKGRHNNLVFKHREQLAGDCADAVAGGEDLIELILERTPDGPLRTEFEFQVLRRRIQPYVLVDYRRRPYVSKFDPEFRVTFDEALEATETDRLFPANTDTTTTVVPGDTIVELKFRRHVPSWFHRIIQAYELRRRSFSKVCEGTIALGLGRDEA